MMCSKLVKVCPRLLTRRLNIANRKYYINNLKCSNFIPNKFSRFFSIKIDNISNEKNSKKIFNLIKTDYKQNNRVNSSDLLNLLKYTDYLTKEESLFLLKCCKHLPDKNNSSRLEIIKKVWDKLIGDNNIPSQEQIITLLKVYTSINYDITDFKKFIKEIRCVPTIELYQELVILTCENGNVEQSLEILTEMKNKNYPITELVFNSLITGYSRSNQFEECESVIDTMTAAGIYPGSETHSRILEGYIENKIPNKALKVFNEYSSLFNQDQILRLIRTSANSNGYLIPNLVKLLPAIILNDNKINLYLRSICIELVYKNMIDECLIIINSLPIPTFQQNEDTDIQGTFLINELIKNDTSVNIIIDVCHSLIKNQRNLRALHVACEISIRRESSNALILLQELAKTEKLRPHYFWPLILRFYRNNGENAVLDIIKKMIDLEIKFDYETVSIYILPNISVTLNNPQTAIKILNDHGLKVTEIINPLLSYFFYKHRLKDILEIVKIYPTKIKLNNLIEPIILNCLDLKLNKNHNTIAKIVNVLTERSSDSGFDFGGQILMEIISNHKMKHDFRTVAILIKEFKSEGVNVSNIAGEVIMQHFSRSNDSNLEKEVCEIIKHLVDKKLSIPSVELFSAHISHPREMNLEELECHLIELQSKNLNTRGVLRRLLQLSVKEGKLDRALEIKTLCEEDKIDISPGMFSSIFDLNVRTKNIMEAEKTLDDMSEKFPKFIIDEHKIIDFAALLINNNEIKKAINILTNRAKLQKIKGGNAIHKNIWNLLNNMATVAVKNDLKTVGKENLTKQLLNTLVKLEYCNFHNTLLGPVLREYILKNDVCSAIETFKIYVKKYKKTPLQQELMSLLIKISNTKEDEKIESNITPIEAKTYLEEIVNLSSNLHGSQNVNLNLIIALSESGTENQLRKVLMNPQVRVNSSQLLKQCEYLSNTNKIDTLIRLAKCSHDLGHIIKESELYNIMLNTFVRENNYQMAISLLERLITDELKVSNDFKRNFMELLKKNNIEIPTNLALHLI